MRWELLCWWPVCVCHWMEKLKVKTHNRACTHTCTCECWWSHGCLSTPGILGKLIMSPFASSSSSSPSLLATLVLLSFSNQHPTTMGYLNIIMNADSFLSFPYVTMSHLKLSDESGNEACSVTRIKGPTSSQMTAVGFFRASVAANQGEWDQLVYKQGYICRSAVKTFIYFFFLYKSTFWLSKLETLLHFLNILLVYFVFMQLKFVQTVFFSFCLLASWALMSFFKNVFILNSPIKIWILVLDCERIHAAGTERISRLWQCWQWQFF